jgi:hypothetical protein
MAVEAFVGDEAGAVVVPMHLDEEAVIVARGRVLRIAGIGECGASGALGVVPHGHFLAAAIGAGIFVAWLALEAGMIGMTYVERHPERLGDAANGRVELVADMLGVFFAEALDDAGFAGLVAEIAKGRKLHPVVLAGLAGRELVGKEKGDGGLVSLVRKMSYPAGSKCEEFAEDEFE